MASTPIAPPAPPAPAVASPAPAPPSTAPPLRGADLLRQHLTDATAARSAAAPAPAAPATPSPTAPADGIVEPNSTPEPPALVSTPAAEPAIAPPVADGKPAEPKPLSVDEVDFDSPIAPPVTAASAEGAAGEVVPPAASPVQPPTATPTTPSTADDPIALATRIASDLGIAPEALTASATGRRLLAYHRQMDAIQTKLGYVPAVEEIEQMAQAAAAIDSIDYEYETQPQSVALWALTTDYNSQTGQYSLRPGALAFIDTFIETANKLSYNQQTKRSPLYEHIATPIVKGAIDELYEAAKTIADNDERAAWVNMAKQVERYFFSKDRYQKENVPDDVRQEREQLAQQRAEQAQRNAQISNQRAQAFENSVFNGFYARLSKDADVLLAQTGIAARYASEPFTLETIRERVLQEAIDASFGDPERGVQPINAFVHARYKTALHRYASAARRAPQSPAALIEQARRIVQPQLRSVARKLFSSEVGKIQAQSQAAHASAQNGAARTEPAGGPGTPRPGSVALATEQRQQPGEDRADFIARQLRERMTTSLRQGQRV